MTAKNPAYRKVVECLNMHAREKGYLHPKRSSDSAKILDALSNEGCDVSDITLGRWFKGESIPRPAAREMLCKVLDMDYEEFNELCISASREYNSVSQEIAITDSDIDTLRKDMENVELMRRTPDACFVAAKAAEERHRLLEFVPKSSFAKSLIANLYEPYYVSCDIAIYQTLIVAMEQAEHESGVDYYPILHHMKTSETWMGGRCHFRKSDTTDRVAADTLLDRLFELFGGEFHRNASWDDRRYGMFRYMGCCILVAHDAAICKRSTINIEVKDIKFEDLRLPVEKKRAMIRLAHLVNVWDDGEGKDDSEVLMLNVRHIISDLIELYYYCKDSHCYWRCFIYLLYMLRENGNNFGDERERTALYNAIMYMDKAHLIESKKDGDIDEQR